MKEIVVRDVVGVRRRITLLYVWQHMAERGGGCGYAMERLVAAVFFL